MTIKTIKRLFTPITPMDRANFYTVQSIHETVPRWEYVFSDCTDGFIALMERSSIDCWVNDNESTVGIKIKNPLRVVKMVYSSDNISQELIMLKKKHH